MKSGSVGVFGGWLVSGAWGGLRVGWSEFWRAGGLVVLLGLSALVSILALRRVGGEGATPGQ